MAMKLAKLGYLAFRDLIGKSAAKPWPRDYAALYGEFAKRQPRDDYDATHAVRFHETARVFGAYLESRDVIELGGHGRIGQFARDALGSKLSEYTAELRESYDLPDESFDVVLCLEVLEHMKDRPSLEADQDDVSCWNYSGALNLLSESYRILRSGGALLITTPNATSTDAIARILNGDHPHLFDPHVRELAPKQVKAFAEHAGFSMEKFGTFYAWTECSAELRQRIMQTISDLGFDQSNRGDDAYYVFRK